MADCDRLVLDPGQDRRSQDHVADMTARQLGQRSDSVELGRANGVSAAQMGLPQGPALARFRLLELDDHVDAPGEGVVEAGPRVRRQNDDAGVCLDPLQEVIGLGVGEAVVGVLNIRALAEHGIGLVE